MDPVVASLANSLAVQTSLVNLAMAKLTEEETWKRPADGANPVGWLLGHITWSRNRLLACLGGEAEALSWGSLFERGAHVNERPAYPDTVAIVGALKRVNEKLKARMEAVTDAELSAPSAAVTPFPDKSVRGTAAFLVFHDAYHVGQIAYAVKLLGKPGLVG